MESQDHVKLLNVKQHFNFTSILDKFNSALIIGKRASGKTTLAKNIASKLNVGSTIIFTHNKSNNDHGFKNIDLVSEYDSMKLKEIYEKQKSPESKPVLIVFDDSIYSNTINNDNNFKQIILNGRHNKIHTIVITQYALGFSPEIRTNFDLIFVFKDNNISNIKRLYEYYFGVLPKFKIFDTLMKTLLYYECLVVNNISTVNTITYYKSIYKNETIQINTNTNPNANEFDI